VEVDLDDNCSNIAERLGAIPAKDLIYKLDSKLLETLDVHRSYLHDTAG